MMTMRYLLDEHVDPAFRTQLLRTESSLEVWIIGDPIVIVIGRSSPIPVVSGNWAVRLRHPRRGAAFALSMQADPSSQWFLRMI